MLITILSQKSDSINTPLPSIWKFMKYFYFSQSKGGKPVPAAFEKLIMGVLKHKLDF